MHSDKIGNKDFIEGIEAAVEAFGINRDGRREIGSPEREVKTVIAEVKRDLQYPFECVFCEYHDEYLENNI